MSTDTLASGTPYSLSPSNSGGAVPANYYAQTTTFAGSTSAASGYTNATGTAARFNQLTSSVMDATGNLYVADGGNNAIRKIDASGVTTTCAGSASGTSGSTDATGTSASFNNPQGIAIDGSGNLVVSDYGNNSIRKIDPTGAVTTFYHSTTTFGPAGLTVDNSGNIIVAAKDLNQIVKITPAAVVSTIAGSTAGYTNATGTSAQFSSPTDVKMDASSNLYVADYTNNAIRMIDPTGVVTTFAGSNVSGNTGGYLDGIGTAAVFNNPAGLSVAPGGIIYVADEANNDIRRIMPDGTVSLAAGSTSQTAGNTDGTGTAASFNLPGSIFVDNTATAYVTEIGGNRVRQVTLTGYSLAGTLPSGLTLDASTGTVSGTVTGTITPVSVTVTAFNAGGFSPAGILAGAPTNDWTGNSTSDWATAGNWTSGVPTIGQNARIGVVSYTGHQPTLAASTNATVNTLAFGANAPTGGVVLTIASGATLTAGNGFTMTGAATVTLNGPGDLTLKGNSPISASTQTFQAELNAVITLSGNNTFITNTSGGHFIFGSDIHGCSAIDVLTGSSTVTGTVQVGRYITGGLPAYRGYRNLSSPVHATGTNGNIYSLNYVNVNPGGMYTSGPGEGFDETGGAPSLYLVREDVPECNSSFPCGNNRGIYDIITPFSYPIASPFPSETRKFNIPVGCAYLCFFRGEKPLTGYTTAFTPGTTPIADTIYATGTLNQGTINVQDWYSSPSLTLGYTVINPVFPATSPSNAMGRGEHLIGNPYPSTIDWNTFSNTDSTSPIYGPNLQTYIYELVSSGTFIAYDEGSTGTGTPPDTTSNYIQSGAGFYVTATGTGTATLTFREAAKKPFVQVPSGTGGVEMSIKPLQRANRQYLRLEMNADTMHSENIVVWFNSANKVGFEPGLDVPYKRGFNIISLSSLSSDNAQLAINKQPLPGNERRIIGLNIDAADNGTYHFNLRQVIGLSKLYDIWLLDAYKKDSVDLRSSVTHDFKIDKSDSASFGSKRFSLLIKQNPAYAYRLLAFTASKVPQVTREVQVVWKTQNEENYTNFTVERSTDGGQTFTILGGVTASAQGTYSYNDNTPVIGQNFYRLKQVDINNVTTYSKTVLIRYDNLADQVNGAKLNIFPNPANGEISLAIMPLTNDPAVYKVIFSSTIGATIKEFTLSETSWQGNVSDLLPGTYLVRVLDNKTQSLVVEGKFVKL